MDSVVSDLEVAVTLRSIAGTVVEELQVPQESTVENIKIGIAERRMLPPGCMRVISGGDILPNSHQLDKNESKVEFTLVISHEVLYKCMRGKLPVQREAAIKALALVVEKGHDKAIEALVPRLRDVDNHVQRAALRALGQVADAEDETVLLAVAKKLNHADPFTQGAALKALLQIAGRGNATAVEILKKLVEEQECLIASRRSASRAFLEQACAELS